MINALQQMYLFVLITIKNGRDGFPSFLVRYYETIKVLS